MAIWYYCIEVIDMKKTTIYFDNSELEMLKRKSFLMNIPVAELIRRGARLICKASSSKEKQAMAALAKIRSMTTDINEESLMKEVVAAQKEIRNEKRTKSRR
jgi:hypothetical protein